MQMNAIQRIWASCAALAIASLVLLWCIFRPDRVAKPEEIHPDTLAQSNSLFAPQPMRFSSGTLRFREVVQGAEFIRKTKVTQIQPGLVRRDSKLYGVVNEIGALEETTSLTHGPVRLVIHERRTTPLVDRLLPNQFWTSSLVSRVEGKPSLGFPSRVGETIELAIWMDGLLAEGTPHKQDKLKYTCEVLERVTATTVHASFVGDALKVKCETIGAADELLVGAVSVTHGGPDQYKDALHVGVSESWYVLSLGLAIQVYHEEFLQSPTGSRHAVSSMRRTIEHAEFTALP
jgi:hypothetical protein